MNESARRTRRLHRVVNGVSASAHSSDLPAVLLARPGLLLHMPPGRGGWPNQKAPHSGSLSPEKHSEFFSFGIDVHSTASCAGWDGMDAGDACRMPSGAPMAVIVQS